MLKKILIILLIGILLFISFKDELLKISIRFFLSKQLNATCTLKKASVSGRSLLIEDLKIASKDVDFRLKRAELKLIFKSTSGDKIFKIILQDCDLKAGNIKKFNNIGKPPQLKGKIKKGPLVLLDLRNISIDIAQENLAQYDVHFRLKAAIQNGRLMQLDDVSIFKASIQYKNNLLRFNLDKDRDNLYTLIIPELKVKDESIKNIRADLMLLPDTIQVTTIKTDFFGNEATLSGIFDFKDYSHVCISLDLAKVSFEKALTLVSKEDSIFLKGLFTGTIRSCFQKGRLSSIEADLDNSQGGLINIKKQAPLAFLKRYLDTPSYKALIDNFKNYQYNKGKIVISKRKNTLVIGLNFNSEQMGERNIAINLHNILGGGG